MWELVVALAPLAALALVSLCASYVPLPILTGIALGLIGFGSLYGVPSGVWYHVVLRRELLQLGPLPEGWLWHPTRHHHLLGEDARRRVRLWFALGGSGFLLIIVGALLGLLALALWFRSGAATPT